jgi:hypothetical protein
MFVHKPWEFKSASRKGALLGLFGEFFRSFCGTALSCDFFLLFMHRQKGLIG